LIIDDLTYSFEVIVLVFLIVVDVDGVSKQLVVKLNVRITILLKLSYLHADNHKLEVDEGVLHLVIPGDVNLFRFLGG
jgi:hypothetical protein